MAERGPERGPGAPRPGGTGPEPRPGAGSDPAIRSETDPAPGTAAGSGSRLRDAWKAIGCVILALLVLGIAIVIGVFDIFF